jgi:multidrug efflux pump subunit AcrA (membrane-fusion protein)
VEEVGVQTGTRTANQVEILSGLAEGDSLVVTGLMQITPRSVVTPLAIQ